MTAILTMNERFASRRRSLKSDLGYMFVEPEEFCALAISNRALLRSDRADAALRGLFDPEAGVYFVVEEERLAASGLSH